MFLFVWEPLAEGVWAWLRYLDNRRKNKPLTPPWDYIWAMMMYGVVNGHIPLADIEREFREGTPYAYRGRRHLDPDLVGVDLRRDVDSSYTIVGQRLALREKL
jgi:hypothetical protein